jgi:spermidine/putrescine-binding protein
VINFSTRRAAGLSAIVLSAVALTSCGSDSDAAQGGDSGPLVIASWGGAFSEATRALAEEFTADTGVEVEVLDAGDHVSTVQSMAEAGTTEWDMLDSMALADSAQLESEGLLAHWPTDVDSELVEKYGQDNVTDYGYAWSGYGFVVVCNKDAVAACPTNFTELFDTEKFPGRRMLPTQTEYTLAAATAVASGIPADEVFPDDTDVDALASTLKGISDDVSVWWTAGDQQNQALQQGEADMGIMASGRAYQLVDEGMNLQVSWNGVSIVGSTNVLENAPHKDEAFQFTTWVADHPAAQAKWMEAMGYTTPSVEALDSVPAELKERLSTNPSNSAGLMQQDIDWWLANKDAVDRAFAPVITG